MKQWKTLKRKLILDHSKFLKVEEHTIMLPNGKIIEHWPWIISNDYVLVLPVTDKNTVLCFKQTKYAVKGTTLAPIAGMIEKNENPLSGAKRELQEEIGYKSGNWVKLGSFIQCGNKKAATGHLFIAFNVKKTEKKTSDDLEEQILKEFTLPQLKKEIFKGSFKITSWSLLMSMGLLYLENADNS